MSILLFLVILAVFCWGILRLPFFRNSGLSAGFIIFFFIIRVAMGVFNCFLAYRHQYVYDSLSFHNIGLNEYYQLTHNPGYFFTETFRDYGKHFSGLLETQQSFWNNLKTNVIVKTLAFINIFTFRSFYVNTLLFNIVVFCGSFALFKSLGSFFSNKTVLAVSVFLFPSALFFTSTIHRDGLVWLFLCFIVYLLKSGVLNPRFKRQIVPLFLCVFFIFTLRNYLSFIVVPGFFAWWFTVRYKKSAVPVFALLTLICIVFFFFTKYLIPAADFPQFIINRQTDFLKVTVGGRTNISSPVLTPDFRGFIKGFPLAFRNGFLLPQAGKMNGWLEVPFFAEVCILEILCLLWVIQQKKQYRPIVVLLVFISIFSILMIGYTIPNSGAIFRYRSIYFHLLFIILLTSVLNKHTKAYI